MSDENGLDDFIDPIEQEFQIEFEEATNGTVKNMMKTMFKMNTHNFKQIRIENRSTRKTLDKHLDEHALRAVRNATVKSVLIKGGAIVFGGVGLAVAILGLAT